MGTHPIFESDFDCLTEMRFTRLLRGGSAFESIPPEKFPPPQLWRKLIPGTPFATVQKELHKRGLHDPWLSHNYFMYDLSMRKPYTLAGVLNMDIIKSAMAVVFALVIIEDVLGIEWKNLSHAESGMWDKSNLKVRGLINLKAPEGDEHIKNYRGWGPYDMRYIGHETPQTKNS